ncbi:AAA family ATPase [Tissierella sp. MB52-C2]|uniref:ATP-binding protein n=1 Tax=Tissierella sp. MB52-C2 TaxID=3070999 RepID=UPI00280B5A01|nr:AAA family ATPase [Tissierella sp. MB52-C2]WMM25944.1 AAA family ATPase [Tissierella sp. MB52-C2]
MLLKELNLLGFGKFENKSFLLDKGINIIYGENEVGKSTLHSFIHGIFYGFLRPNVKSTLYLEEHEKYNPWNSNKYAGIIRFEHNGKYYRIERNFTKGEERTKVIDEVTGQDITKDIDVGKGRVFQPGIHFFGFNTRVFSNTIFIKQLDVKTDEKLANEVTEKMINVTTALDDNLSIDEAIGELKIRLADIGTDKAYTRPYARNLEYIEQLQEKRKNIIIEKENYESYVEEEARLKNMLNIETEKLSKLKDKLAAAEILEKAKILEEAEILLDEIKSIENKILDLKDYANFSIDQYNEIINLNSSIVFLDSNILDKEKELIEIEDKLKLNYKNDHKDNEEKIVKINNDYNTFEEWEEEKHKVLYAKDNHQIEFLKRDYTNYESKLSKNRLNKIVISVALIILLFIGTVFKKYIIFTIGIPLIISLIYISKKSKEIEVIRETAKTEIDKIYTEEEENRKRIEEIEILQRELLQKYNIENKIEFKRFLDKIQMESYRNKESSELYNELNNKKDFLIKKINEGRLKKEDIENKLKDILYKNNVNNIQGFREGLDKKDLYEKYLKKLEVKKELLFKTMGENSVEDLKGQLKGLITTLDRTLLGVDKNQLRYEIERTNESISDIKIALRGVEENLKLLGENIDKLVEVEEELERREKYKAELEFKTKSLELAVKTIEELSKDIHHEFAPSINKQISEIIESITDGKYNKVRISEELDISIENPITGEIIGIDSLSGGTIDQLYFSLRLGITNSMVGDKLPLILDDCFVQYDDNRLKNIMKFLYEISYERQIILFTCHNRENIILDELGVDFNLITLS